MKHLLLLAAAAGCLLTTSCNTFIGMGRDFRLMGEQMERKANESRGGGDHQQSGAPIY